MAGCGASVADCREQGQGWMQWSELRTDRTGRPVSGPVAEKTDKWRGRVGEGSRTQLLIELLERNSIRFGRPSKHNIFVCCSGELRAERHNAPTLPVFPVTPRTHTHTHPHTTSPTHTHTHLLTTTTGLPSLPDSFRVAVTLHTEFRLCDNDLQQYLCIHRVHRETAPLQFEN